MPADSEQCYDDRRSFRRLPIKNAQENLWRNKVNIEFLKDKQMDKEDVEKLKEMEMEHTNG